MITSWTPKPDMERLRPSVLRIRSPAADRAGYILGTARTFHVLSCLMRSVSDIHKCSFPGQKGQFGSYAGGETDSVFGREKASGRPVRSVAIITQSRVIRF